MKRNFKILGWYMSLKLYFLRLLLDCFPENLGVVHEELKKELAKRQKILSQYKETGQAISRKCEYQHDYQLLPDVNKQSLMLIRKNSKRCFED